MAWLFSNLAKSIPISQRWFKIFPNTNSSYWKLPKDLQNWPNFTKSGHTVPGSTFTQLKVGSLNCAKIICELDKYDFVSI